jgi:hypothetical protein
MIIQVAEVKKLLKDIEVLHEETVTSLKAEIAKLENELLEARKANREIAKLAMDRYFEIKRLKKEIEKEKVFLVDDGGKPIKEFTLKGTLKLIKEPAEEKLEVGKWYHTTDFSLEELKELLPVGTKVEAEKEVFYQNIDIEPPNVVEQCEVKEVIKGIPNQKTYISKGEAFFKEWFKIIEE